MADVKLMVLYPYPEDSEAFDADYEDHLELLHEKTGLPRDPAPYTVTRFTSPSEDTAPFYQLFSLPFPSNEALQEMMASSAMQEVAADAARISSGGAPVMLIGREA